MPFGYFECLLMCCTALVLNARVKQVPSKDKTDFTKISGLLIEFFIVSSPDISSSEFLNNAMVCVYLFYLPVAAKH